MSLIGTIIASQVFIAPELMAAGPVPTIIQQPSNIAASQDSMVTLSVVAECTESITYQWYRDFVANEEILLKGETSPVLSVPVFTEQYYHVVVQSRFGSVASRKATVTPNPARPYLAISSQGNWNWSFYSSLERLGLVVRLPLGSSSPSRVEWLRNGSLVQEGVGELALILSPDKTGLYSARLVIDGVTLETESVPIAYLERSDSSATVMEGVQVSLSVTAYGDNLQYQWLDQAGKPLEENDRFQGTRSNRLFINRTSVTDAGSYLCKITNGFQTATRRLGLVVKGRPYARLVPINNWQVGSEAPFYFSTSGEGSGFQILSVTGLPPGLKFNFSTYSCDGYPTAAGTYAVKVVARNIYGVGPVAVSPIVVEPLPEYVQGRYCGIVCADEALNLGLGGRFTLDVASTAFCSGVVAFGNRVRAFTSRLKGDNGAFLIENVILARNDQGLPVEVLNCRITRSDASGVISGPVSTASIQLKRCPWRNGIQAVAHAGTNIVAMKLDPQLVGSALYPQGTGYFGGSIGLNGVFTAAARFADNTVATTSATICQDGSVPFFWLLYGGKGSVQGWGLSENGEISGALTWTKRPLVVASRSYRDGFPSHQLNLGGGRMRTYSSKSDLVLGWLPGADNAIARLDGLLSQTFTITSSTALMVPGSPLSLSLMRDANKFTGKVLMSGRKGDAYGVFVDQLGSGVGHVQMPVSSASNAPLLSMPIEIRPLSMPQ